MNNKSIFSNRKKLKSSTKNFIIAFGIFILILGISSVVLFMYSLDFDLSNLVETTEQEETTSEYVSKTYSVESLTGKSNVMFVVLDEKEDLEFICCAMLDFDNKSFKIKQINGDSQINFGDRYKSVSGIYCDKGENGLKDLMLDYCNISVDKYAIFDKSGLKKFFLSFNGIVVNVPQNISYHSNEFNIEFEAGEQSISAEKTVNYLFAIDGELREKALCDVAISILNKDYVKNADRIFKKFVNSSKTDISVIDFSDSLETLEVYCNAEDKFLPTPFSDGE